jgi:hypothetical protein
MVYLSLRGSAPDLREGFLAYHVALLDGPLDRQELTPTC